MTAYQPACDACRAHDPHTFHRGCAGCQARRIAAERAAALTQAQVAGADSMFNTLPEKKS